MKQERNNLETVTEYQKLKIFFEDESIKVFHNVEYFIIKLDSNKEIYKVKYLKRMQDKEFHIVKSDRYITNYDNSDMEQDGQYKRKAIIKEQWRSDDVYSFSSNNIVRVDYEGKIAHQVKRDGVKEAKNNKVSK